jgi:hypothetical protein
LADFRPTQQKVCSSLPHPANAIALDGVLAETLRKDCDAWASPTVARVYLSQTAELILP